MPYNQTHRTYNHSQKQADACHIPLILMVYTIQEVYVCNTLASISSFQNQNGKTFKIALYLCYLDGYRSSRFMSTNTIYNIHFLFRPFSVKWAQEEEYSNGVHGWRVREERAVWHGVLYWGPQRSAGGSFHPMTSGKTLFK